MTIWSAEDHLHYLWKQGFLRLKSLPPNLIVLPSQTFLQKRAWDSEGFLGAKIHHPSENTSLAVLTDWGFGGPALTTRLEVVKVLGVRNIIFLGLAGGLGSRMVAGEICFCEKAAIATQQVLEFFSVQQAERPTFPADASVFGASIDNPYQETNALLSNLVQQGVSVIDMEVAYLFRESSRLGFNASAYLVISDLLTEDSWTPLYHHKSIQQSISRVLDHQLN